MYFKNLLAFNFLIKSFSKSLLLRMQRYNTNTPDKDNTQRISTPGDLNWVQH